MYKKINLKDKEIQLAINNELLRQEEHIELIASENYVSEDVLKATGSILTNKYGEGYPGKRYYNGCENIDQVEKLAIERLQQLFKVKFANVQPYSGSTANAAVFSALLEPGDKILGLDLNSGGHLTHGMKINFSGKFYDTYTYSVDAEGYLNYDQILQIAKKVNPKLIICGFTAYSRVVDFKKFKAISDQVGAYLLADISHIAGLIIAKAHPSPVGYADVISSTTHKTLRGARGAIIMTNNEYLAKKIDRAVFPGHQGGPLFHSIAGKAVAFNEALQPFYYKYIRNVVKNSIHFANEFLKKKVEIVSNGTDNHLFVINTKKSYNLTGKKASEILQKINITVNKNTIPNDDESPFITSGIRLGTAAMSSRGFKNKEFTLVAKIIHKALMAPKNEILHQELKAKVLDLTKNFPIKKSYWLN
ncbi:serine hydroxymethyltransferase [[Mycoplasma] collis]|uniref:serine hydroxymethyltransferase n=1 Tax=[Mycoplasma] collis TaxID=2127 RepID=UPI00051C7AF0|nr:serine hydroxymethyltransferase [[Mycoplasma] collis]